MRLLHIHKITQARLRGGKGLVGLIYVAGYSGDFINRGFSQDGSETQRKRPLRLQIRKRFAAGIQEEFGERICLLLHDVSKRMQQALHIGHGHVCTGRQGDHSGAWVQRGG